MHGEMTRDQIKAWYDISADMLLSYDDQGMPLHLEDKAPVYFRPLESDASSRRLEVYFKLCMEVTEYGVFVRVTNGRLLLWKEFPRQFTLQTELSICRLALFEAAARLVREKAQQSDMDAFTVVDGHPAVDH